MKSFKANYSQYKICFLEAGGDITEGDMIKETPEKDFEAISKLVSSLARLEQSHMEQNKILITENQELLNEDVTKISKN